MSRRLILLRHAKSAWDDPTLADKVRPLNARGRRDAPCMGAWLASQQIVPDLVLVSGAVRTRETWDLFGPELGPSGPTVFREDLYDASATGIIGIINAVVPEVATLLVVGHNSGLGEVATGLVGHGDAGVRAAMSVKFPTSALAIIDFDAATWAAAQPGSGRLVHFVTPKSLGPNTDAPG
jgi:phosphohistidine phosphatase